MKVTRFRFRLVEMALCPLAVVIIDGLIHVGEGKPFMSEYLWGSVFAIFLVRGLDALRAYQGTWPENSP